MVEAPERIWAASVTENYGEWQTTTDGLPRPTEYVRADLYAALEAQLAERVKVKPQHVAYYDDGQFHWMSGIAPRNCELYALEATPPAPKVTECATEGCEQTATVRFERGGVGSDYCHGCYMRIQTLTAAQEAEKP